MWLSLLTSGRSNHQNGVVHRFPRSLVVDKSRSCSRNTSGLADQDGLQGDNHPRPRLYSALTCDFEQSDHLDLVIVGLRHRRCLAGGNRMCSRFGVGGVGLSVRSPSCPIGPIHRDYCVAALAHSGSGRAQPRSCGGGGRAIDRFPVSDGRCWTWVSVGCR